MYNHRPRVNYSASLFDSLSSLHSWMPDYSDSAILSVSQRFVSFESLDEILPAFSDEVGQWISLQGMGEIPSIWR